MIRFYEASAWVKAYVREAETDQVLSWRRQGTPALSRLSAVEIPSSFARRRREGILSPVQERELLHQFDEDLLRTLVFDVTPEIVLRARKLLERHPLRASDAIQLGTCVYLRDHFSDVELCAFDARVCQAAEREGMVVASAPG